MSSPRKIFTCEDCGGKFLAFRARFCHDCRYHHRGPVCRKYTWTEQADMLLRNRYDGKIPGRAAEVARALGWPCWLIKRRAAQLGLCHPANCRDWTEEETSFLLDYTGKRTSFWIAKRLGRTLSSVILKQKRLTISRRVRDGYTMRELELCFGVDHHVIDRWIKAGKLRMRRRKTARKKIQGGDPYKLQDIDILEFIKNHPMEFRLDKVDQFWFMDLILSSALVRRALEAARDEAA